MLSAIRKAWRRISQVCGSFATIVFDTQYVIKAENAAVSMNVRLIRFTIRDVILLIALAGVGWAWWADRSKLTNKLEMAETAINALTADSAEKRDLLRLTFERLGRGQKVVVERDERGAVSIREMRPSESKSANSLPSPGVL